MTFAVLAPLFISCDFSYEGLNPILQVPSDAGADVAGMTASQSDARYGGSQGAPDAGPADTARPLDAVRDRGGPQTDAFPGDLARPAPDGPPRDSPARPPDLPPFPDTPSPGLQVLLLVGEQMQSPGDLALRSRLQGLGFAVRMEQVVDIAQAMEARTLAAGAALVVMSNSLDQGSGLPAVMRTVAVPIFCSKSAFWDNLGIGEERLFDVSQGESDLQIVAPGHPLAGGLTGEVRVVSQPSPFELGQPVAAAIRIATIVEEENEPDEVLIFGLEKGAAGRFEPAPARRVGWFARETTFRSLTDDGWALFDAAVKWLTTGP
jgi:hypothetical protein